MPRISESIIEAIAFDMLGFYGGELPENVPKFWQARSEAYKISASDKTRVFQKAFQLSAHFRHLIYRATAAELEFEIVDEDVYTLDINVKYFKQDVITSIISLAKEYDEYRTHELLKGKILRLHFEINE